MIEEVFSLDEIIDNMRIIYKNTSPKESYELIKISNEDGDIIAVPFSRKSMYDVYTIIDKRVISEFNTLLDKDLLMARKYEEFKIHDHMLSSISKVDINKSKTKYDKFRDFILDEILFNRNLLEEFEVDKIKDLIMDTIDSEYGMLDTYYINSYMEMYEDVKLDFETILIKSLNEYTDIVAKQTKAHYPRINDYGTAQEYFYKIVSKTTINYMSNDKSVGRMYYRDIVNKEMIRYANNKCSWNIHKITVHQLLILVVEFLGTIIVLGTITVPVCLFLFFVNTINVFFKIRKYSSIVTKCESNIIYENNVLKELSIIENKNINNWYKINK